MCAPISRTAARDTSVSRHHGEQNEVLLKPLEHHVSMILRDLREVYVNVPAWFGYSNLHI